MQKEKHDLHSAWNPQKNVWKWNGHFEVRPSLLFLFRFIVSRGKRIVFGVTRIPRIATDAHSYSRKTINKHDILTPKLTNSPSMTFCATNLKVYHAIVDMNQTSFCPQNCKLSQMQLLSLTGNWDLISQIRKALKGQVSEWVSNQGNNWGEKLFKYFSWRLILLKLREILA